VEINCKGCLGEAIIDQNTPIILQFAAEVTQNAEKDPLASDDVDQSGNAGFFGSLNKGDLQTAWPFPIAPLFVSSLKRIEL
jgi:hypothetical protein